MIDPQTETTIPLTKAPAHIPGRPHIATLYRWAFQGTRGRTLETLMVGGRRYTSLEAIARFLQPADAPAAKPSASQRQSETAARELERIGV